MKYIEKQLSFCFHGRLFSKLSSFHLRSYKQACQQSETVGCFVLVLDNVSSSLRFVGESGRVCLKSSAPPLLADDIERAGHSALKRATKCRMATIAIISMATTANERKKKKNGGHRLEF